MSTPCLLTFEFTAVHPSAMRSSWPSPLALDKLLLWSLIARVPVSVWFPRPQSSPRIFHGNHNHKQIYLDSTQVTLAWYFNIFKLKSVYWETISYNKICSSLKFSFLALLMSIANWLLGNQRPAMLTWLMHLHFQYCFWVQYQESYTTSTLRLMYKCQIISWLNYLFMFK